MNFTERIKALTDKQLDKLERVLERLQTTGFADPLTALNEQLVQARTYELSLQDEHADFATLRGQALADLAAGRLKPAPLFAPSAAFR